jgi:hypothetical protein
MTLAAPPSIPRAVRGAGNLELAAALLIAGFLAWLWLPLARIGVDAHHDGIMLKPALDVLSGQVLFRDSFNQYGALTVYLHALGLWIHPSLFTLKAMSVLATVLSLFIFYAAWREILPTSLAIAAAAMYIGFIPFFDSAWIIIPWSSDFAMLFQAVALYAILQVLKGRSGLFWPVGLGVACAAVLWCRQPVGILLVVAVTVILSASVWAGLHLPKQSWLRVVVWVGLGFLAVNALMIIRLADGNALGPWWEQNIVWPKRWALAADSGANRWGLYWSARLDPITWLASAIGLGLLLLPGYITHFHRGRRGVLFASIYYLLLGWLAWWGWAWWRQWFIVPRAGWVGITFVVVSAYTVFSFRKAFLFRAKGSTAHSHEFFLVAALTGVSLASLAQLYPVPCPRHFFWALGPVFGLVLYALWRWTGVRALGLATAVGILLLPNLHDKLERAGQTLRQPMETITEPSLLAGIKELVQERDFYRDLDKFYQSVESSKPGTPVVLFGSDALLICFTRNLMNPGPYYVTWNLLIEPEASRMRWVEILGRRPLVMVHRYDQFKVERFVEREAYAEVWRREQAGVVIYAPREWAGELIGVVPTAKP